MSRNISDIAKDIIANWPNLNENMPAYSYLQELLKINNTDNRNPIPGLDDDYMVVAGFLSVCKTFKSHDLTATNLKNELRAIIGAPIVKKRYKKKIR